MLCVVVPSDIQPFEESDIGDHPEDYVVSIAVSIPGLISNIKYTTSRGCTHSALVAGISTEPTISFESSKNWVFIVSHNYNDEKKKPSDPDFFMSLSFSPRRFIRRSMTYHSAMLNPPARYVLLQVVFDNDDAEHSHTYTSCPIYFDGFGTNYQFLRVATPTHTSSVMLSHWQTS